MPAEFHFLRPEWLLAVPAVLALAWYFARRRLRPGSWLAVIDPALQPHVLARGTARGTDWRWWLVGLGGTLAAVALAGPAWERIEQPVYRSAQALVIALDLSRSMDAEDVSPSRLARAKLKLLDILEHRRSGQTALIVYSGNAFTVTPLTTDTDTIAALVSSLSTDIMPSQGSNPAAAVEKARQLLEQAGAGNGTILLITDGGVTPAAIDAAKEARQAGHRLSILGIGTLEGAPIPERGGGFVTDWSGQIAVPRLEARELGDLAEAGGGRFSVMTTDSSDLARLQIGDFGTAGAVGDDGQLTTDQWRDEGPWLLLVLVPVAALAFRRGWILVLLVCVLPPGGAAQAFEWQDLWLTPDQQGRTALEEGRAGEAAELFEDPAWRGVAEYRAGDYRGSAVAFAGREDPDGLYNLGNALARQGKFEEAIAAWERTLELNPGDEDAAYNRDLVRRLLEQQQAPGQQGNQPGGESEGQSAQEKSGASAGQQGDPSRADGESGADQSASDRAGEETRAEDLEALQRELERAAREAQEQQAQGQPGQVNDPAALAAARREQERAQAMEQWLRRIPDDPGGLLRRKFRYQYQRQGVDQDGNALWYESADPW
jgi:Ca-activated chloride channel family protein